MALPNWETGPWTQDSGQNSSPLEPAGSGVIKTLPPADTPTIEGDLPKLDDEVAASNAIFLEIKSSLMSKRWLMMLAFPFLALALAASLALLTWASVGDFGRERTTLLAAALFVISVVSYGAYPGFFLTWVGFEDEPIRFCRSSRKIYWFRAPRQRWPGYGEIPRFGSPEIKVFDWEQIRGEIVRQVVFTGNTARRDSHLQLAVLDPETKKVIERFRIGESSVAGLFSTRVALWETIRRFMEIGPSEVPDIEIKVAPRNFFECVDKFNPLTLASKAPSGPAQIICYILALVMLPLAPVLLFMSLAVWVTGLTARKVDWGELENTVFKLSPDDPSLRRPLDPAITQPDEWRAELRHCKTMATAWISFFLAEIAFSVWWIS